MDYNIYYPVQSGHMPLNRQHVGGLQMQQPLSHSGGQLMISPMPHIHPRQTLSSSSHYHHQIQHMQSPQPQTHQSISHHPQQSNPQQQQPSQQQHASYQQIHSPHPHGSPLSHSPHPHHQLNHNGHQHIQQPQQHSCPPQQQHQSQNYKSHLSSTMSQSQHMTQRIVSHSPHHQTSLHLSRQTSPNQIVRSQTIMLQSQVGINQSNHQQQTSFNTATVSQQPNLQSCHQNHRGTHHHSSSKQMSPNNPQRSISQTEFRIIELNRRLQRRPQTSHSQSPLPSNSDDSVWWEKFVSDFFEDDATITLRVQEDEQVDYSLGRTLIPRFFRSYFAGGVTDFNLNLRDPKEIYGTPNVITLDCDQALIVTNNVFKHQAIPSPCNVVVHTEGHLVLDFVSDSSNNLSIKTWRFSIRCSREYVDRSVVTSKAIPNNQFAESITKNGFTKTTYTYLKMCTIMKPMQELMCQYKTTRMDPRACLKDHLFSRYNYKSPEDNKATSCQAPTNKRRKRKQTAATPTTTKKHANQVQEQQSNALTTSPIDLNEKSPPNEDIKTTLPDVEPVSEIPSPQRDLAIENNETKPDETKEPNGLLEKASPNYSEVKSPPFDVTLVEAIKASDVVSANNLDTPPKDEESCNGDTSRPVSEEPSEKENNDSTIIEEGSVKIRKDNHPNVMNSIPEDREENRKMSPCETIVAKLPPTVNNKIAVQANGNASKQNRRRSSERKETLREGLMRTLDFVIAIKDLKTDHPSSLWRITGNNLLQQFEPKIQNCVVLYESTNQYAGWNTEIRRDYIGVDVKVTHYNRHHLTVERLLLNLQNIEELESFQDLHFSIYLQILISNVLDPLFGEGLQENPQHLDYYLPSRKIIEDIIKRHKSKILSKLKLNEAAIKNFEKYPSLIINPLESTGQSPMCRACNTNPSTQVVNFGNMSYDLHSYKPVKVTSEPTKVDDKNQQNHLCDHCLHLVQLYSEIHHMGWKFTNIARDKVTPLQLKGKSIRNIIEECINDEEWMRDNFEERDTLWSKIERL